MTIEICQIILRCFKLIITKKADGKASRKVVCFAYLVVVGILPFSALDRHTKEKSCTINKYSLPFALACNFNET